MSKEAPAKLPDYYKVLGVSENASESEIKEAYRSTVKLHHPDSRDIGMSPIQHEDADGFFRAATEAYRVLSDSGRRSTYDQGRTMKRLVNAFADSDWGSALGVLGKGVAVPLAQSLADMTATGIGKIIENPADGLSGGKAPKATLNAHRKAAEQIGLAAAAEAELRALSAQLSVWTTTLETAKKEGEEAKSKKDKARIELEQISRELEECRQQNTEALMKKARHDEEVYAAKTALKAADAAVIAAEKALQEARARKEMTAGEVAKLGKLDDQIGTVLTKMKDRIPVLELRSSEIEQVVCIAEVNISSSEAMVNLCRSRAETTDARRDKAQKQVQALREKAESYSLRAATLGPAKEKELPPSISESRADETEKPIDRIAEEKTYSGDDLLGIMSSEPATTAEQEPADIFTMGPFDYVNENRVEEVVSTGVPVPNKGASIGVPGAPHESSWVVASNRQQYEYDMQQQASYVESSFSNDGGEGIGELDSQRSIGELDMAYTWAQEQSSKKRVPASLSTDLPY